MELGERSDENKSSGIKIDPLHGLASDGQAENNIHPALQSITDLAFIPSYSHLLCILTLI